MLFHGLPLSIKKKSREGWQVFLYNLKHQEFEEFFILFDLIHIKKKLKIPKFINHGGRTQNNIKSCDTLLYIAFCNMSEKKRNKREKNLIISLTIM